MWTGLVFVAVFAIVRRHYEVHLPHYDSMAGIVIARAMNVTRMQGWEAGIDYVTGVSTGWLQPVFGLLLAWLPVRTPEWLTSLNFLLLLLAQAAIVNFGRSHGLSLPRLMVMSMLPLVPAVMSGWNGGMADLRRDSQLAVLSYALLFQSLAYVNRPSLASGVLLGVIAGLTQWSRDNAASILVILSLPAVALAVGRGWSRGGLLVILRAGAVPLGIFVLLAATYYGSTIHLTYIRYTTIVWGFDGDRWEMLETAVDAPWQLLFGGRYAGTYPPSAEVTTGLLALLAVVAAILIRAGRLVFRPRAVLHDPYRLLVVSGLFVTVAMVLYTSLVIGASSAGAGIALLPAGAGLIAVLAGLLGMVKRGPTVTRRTMAAVPAFVAVAVAVTFLARLILNERAQPAWAQEDPRDVPAARALAIELSDRASDRPVAILWTTGVGRHTLTVYLAQAGQRPVVDFASALVGHPDYIDLDQPLRPGDQPEELLERLDRAIRRHADFVLVCRDTSMYQDVQGTQLWPYLIGRPVVERLLADQAFVSVYDFTFQGRPFSLLENRSARRVPTPGSDG